MTREQEVAWTRRQFLLLREGGVWGIPRSGLIFTRRGDSLVLTSRMPYDPKMPCSESELREQQDDEYEAIRSRAVEAGITVSDET